MHTYPACHPFEIYVYIYIITCCFIHLYICGAKNFLECLLLASFCVGALVGSFFTWLLTLPRSVVADRTSTLGSPSLGPVLAPSAFAALKD